MSNIRPADAPEFRRQMVELVRAGRCPEALSRDSEPSPQAIRNRLAQAHRDTGSRSDGPGMPSCKAEAMTAHLAEISA